MIDPSNAEGLVSCPSFHAAGALMTTWRCGAHGSGDAVGVLNTGLIAATVLFGAHYVIDLLATVALCGVGLALYRVLVPIAQPARPPRHSAPWPPDTSTSGIADPLSALKKELFMRPTAPNPH